MFENFIFLDWFWIILSILLSGFLIYGYFRGAKNYNFLAVSDIASVYKKNTYWYGGFYVVLVGITLVFGMILAKPTLLLEKETIKKNGIDIQIVFDVSYSMIAKDISPSRIIVAKNVIKDFIEKLQGDAVGIVLFAGKPFSSTPLTFDYEFLNEFITDISVDSIDQDRPHLRGTAIGDALVLAAESISGKQDEREKVIILMTDGEANTGVDPLVALRYLKEKNIKTYTIGVGKDQQTFIELVDDFGFTRKTPIGGIDEQTLQKIAEETGGKYYRADSELALDNIFSDIEKIEKTEVEIESLTLNKSKYTEFLLGLILLMIGLLYMISRKKIQP